MLWRSEIPEEPHQSDWLKFFLRFMVSLYGLIPISLYAYYAMIKAFLTWGPFDQTWISWMNGSSICSDKSMMHEGKRPIAFQSEALEELGMVSFLFSDKTGTLTRNEMVLKKSFLRENFRVQSEMQHEIL